MENNQSDEGHTLTDEQLNLEEEIKKFEVHSDTKVEKNPIDKRLFALLTRVLEENRAQGKMIVAADSVIFDFLSQGLLKDQGLAIEWSEKMEEVSLPHVDWLTDVAQKNIAHLLETMVEFHNRPIITDKYKGMHSERRKDQEILRFILGGIFYKVLTQSKLVGNSPAAFVRATDMVWRTIGEHRANTKEGNQKVKRLKGIFLNFNSFLKVNNKDIVHYNAWTYDEKLTLAHKINPKIEETILELQKLFNSRL